MYTTIDLRLKYKSETGHNAVFDSNLTTKYTEWLEINHKKADRFRERFKRDTAENATYWHKRSKKLVYNKNYRLWLEELHCRAKGILETLKK